MAWVELFAFLLALALLLFNVYFYLYKQGTYKIYFVATFYAFSLLTFLFRIALCIVFIAALRRYETAAFEESSGKWEGVAVIL